MKRTLIKILLACFLLSSSLYSFDTIRGAGSTHKNNPEKEKTFLQKVDLWYLDLIGKTQDKPINVQSTDVIIINSDRSVTINGHNLKFGTHIDKWIKILGDDYRTLGREKEAYLWDDLGIGISLKKSYTGEVLKERVVNHITIQLISFREMFPDYDDNDPRPIRKPRKGGVKEFYFKGLIQIEDGYLSRETSFDQFQKSKVGRRYQNTFSRPSKYHMSYNKDGKPFLRYKDEYAIQFNIIDLTYKRFIKRISIY